MVKKRSDIIPALILLAAVLAVLAAPAPDATLDVASHSTSPLD